MPRFSIIIPAYNNVEFLPGCLESVLAQDETSWEAFVVVDGSPDTSAEVAASYARSDARIKVIDKPKNEGVHLARRSGVEACSGDYVLLLDADDELAPGALSALSAHLGEDADMFHFGIDVVDVDVAEEERLAFESFINKPVPPLEGKQICDAAFAQGEGFLQDWRVTQRLYTSSLIKRSYEAMTSDRLGRAQDAYEYFVISSLSRRQVSVNDAVVLRYFYGRGVNGASELSSAAFAKSISDFQVTMDAMSAYASSVSPELESAAADARTKLCDLLMNDWLSRVPESRKLEDARLAASVVGAAEISFQLMRLTRDQAYREWSTSQGAVSCQALKGWFFLADELASSDPDALGPVYEKMRTAARDHLVDLEHTSGPYLPSGEPQLPVFAHDYERQRIRIFVTTHKDVDTFYGEALQPVQVGTAKPRPRLAWAYQDDTGDNIAALNAQYCELTTQYWAWKNVQAEYYGFCHYRRYFNFSDAQYEENAYGEVMDERIDWDTKEKYRLDKHSIARVVEGFDLVTTGIKDLHDFPEAFESPFDHYERAPYLHVEDLCRVIDILGEMHPDYVEDAETFLTGHHSCFCNMFIMRKELFDRYCAWLFPLLERFCEGWDTTHLSREALRTPGHLSERLLNIFILHEKRTNPQLKSKELQCVHFEHPEPCAEEVRRPSDSHGLPVIPVVLAADSGYVPMLTTTVLSVLKNASSSYFYDIVVLEKDITARQKHMMQEFFSAFSNAQVRFVNVTSFIDSYQLSTSNEHISVETYYRFLIQKVLPDYDKVLYLDSDLIACGDVSELYRTELGDNLLAAALDIDYLGNLNMNDGKRMAYTKEVLGLEDPYGYFQAGVLVLNTGAMRELYPFERWLEIASEPKYIYDDQDILNAHCQGRVTYLPNEWNVMNDCGGRISKVFSFAPAEVYDRFLAAYAAPKVVHYAGSEKPWKPGPCDQLELYWSYARLTPFYERLLEMRCSAPRAVVAENPLPARAIGEKSSLRKMVDPLMPLGTRRRELAKAVVRIVRGRD